MAKEQSGQRWITVKKEGPLHGRKLLISGDGRVVGGHLPRAMQGHFLKDLAGYKADESTSHYDDYSHDELKEVHKDFSDHHAQMKRDLHDDVHGMAKHLRAADLEGDESLNLVKEIRKRGGISMGEGKDSNTEYKSSIHSGVRKAVSRTGGMPLDEMADEMGMSADDLVQKLSGMKPTGYAKIEDYYDKAKQQMGDDYKERESGVNELEKHVKAIGAAKARKEADESRKAKEQPKPEPKEEPKAEPAAGGEDVGAEAYGKLKETYPEDTLGWAKDAKWNKEDVDLKDVDMARRPGGRDMGKVNGIASDVKAGKKTDPVHLVRTPGGKKLKIADGYHRTLGNLKGGNSKVSAYVGDVKDESGPWDKEMHDKKLNLSDAEKAKKEAAGGEAPASAPEDKAPAGDNVQRKGNRLDGLHDDVKSYMDGKTDANSLLQKHDKLIQAMARNVASKRGGEAEDLAQEGRTAAFKTLEALKNGTQKPKEGTHLGEHMMRRVKQGLSEGARQGNERPLSRESTKLAALVNQHRKDHINETGQDPSEDDLFNRVSGDEKFNSAKFAAPGTKKNIEDPREKFNSLREAMKNQGSTSSLDEGKTDDEGSNMGTKGGNIADPKGSAEDQAVANENEKEMQEKRGKLHDVLGQLGLSESERHAVAHRFGVGHADHTGAVLPWDKVAEHMSKDMNKKVNPETAKKHFNNGRSKLHQHIGDDRMSLLMQKSLTGDIGIYLLRQSLFELGLYDILKSMGNPDGELDAVWLRLLKAGSREELLKSLEPHEYVEECQNWADGSVTAKIITYRIGG